LQTTRELAEPETITSEVSSLSNKTLQPISNTDFGSAILYF
jgi:hypothetical protein